MSEYVKPVNQKVWKNILFFVFISLVTLIAGPIYLWKNGISHFELALTFFYMVATGMGITAGYHRLFSHATYQAHPAVKFLALFFGAAAFEQSALEWSSQHRDHHRYVDTDRDPYNIKKGFFYAHVGWLIFWKHTFDFSNVQDLQKDRMVMHQNDHYHMWAVVSGILVPVLIGALGGHALGAFIFAVCFRLVFVYNATFCINSVCHMFGKATYDIYSTAKDHWFVALITNGEGYHNFHHRFPSDYRNAMRWYQWDPSKWLIASLSWFGLTYDLKRVSKFKILDARITAENQRLRDWAAQSHDATIADKFHEHYEVLRAHLIEWEKATKDYHALIYDKLTAQSHTLKENMLAKVAAAKQNFWKTRETWKRMTEMPLRMAGI